MCQLTEVHIDMQTSCVPRPAAREEIVVTPATVHAVVRHMQTTTSQTVTQRRGTTALEFVLMLPLVLLLAFGCLDLGRAVRHYCVMSNAATAGATRGDQPILRALHEDRLGNQNPRHGSRRADDPGDRRGPAVGV